MNNIKSYFNIGIFKDIRFWIVLFFIIRLAGITNPPLEIAHNWRQTTVTMVARNFLEIDNNILYPRVDFAGENSGITAMEFPILNYLIYIVSKIFGYSHWYGRLINLIVSSFGLYFFYKLVKKYFKEKVAFNSTLILLFSIWFAYSRKIMPDTFSVSFIIIGIYYGTNFFDESKNKIKNLIIYIFFITIGSLSKLPAAYMLSVFIVFILNKEFSLNQKIIFSLASIIGLGYTVYWYFFWFPYLSETYGIKFFMGKSLSVAASEIFSHLPETLYRFYDTAFKYIAFVFFIFGLIISVVKKTKKVLLVFLISFLSFLVIVFKSGTTFYHHTYYIIPFVPVMALVSGIGISFIKNKKISILILFAIAVEGISNQQHDFRIHDKELAILSLEKDLEKVSNKDDLIIINSGDCPTPLYFSHRKGWETFNKKINDKNYIIEKRKKGLKHIIILKKSFGDEIKLDYPVSINNENYCIYSFKNK